jgi:hypothetical protein
MSESCIVIRLLRMYFPWDWEFGLALSKLRYLGGEGVEPPKLPPLVHRWPESQRCQGVIGVLGLMVETSDSGSVDGLR